MKMIVFLAVALSSHLVVNCGVNQSLDTSVIIKNIRKSYIECNKSLVTYSKKEVSFFDESTEGGIVVAYYDHDQLKKVAVSLMGETSERKMEYYTNGDNLLFAIYYLAEFDFNYTYTNGY